jgi:hypothetical protein
MNAIHRNEITRYLEAFDFSGLFTDPTIGWDWPEIGEAVVIPWDEDSMRLETVAEKQGVKVLVVPPGADGQIPLSKDRRKLEQVVRPRAAEHLLIFTDAAKTRQIWQWTQRRPGKPVAFREITWDKGQANELLIQKLSSIAFTLDEEDGLDITGVVQRLSDSLDRDKVTKKFYDHFKKQKDIFQKFIGGLADSSLQQWYTSLMLNRIMFCYFLQRKGFLDGDTNYLRNRLETVRDAIGDDRFHSFYRSFLRRLFHEGLGGVAEDRDEDFSELIGDVPYLNGGIFDEHPIERDNPSLQIPDHAFEKIFGFFDQYDWHLDERPLAKDTEINPEVLGYVFEKYTNQKEMGAYYTKEDITEYISKNCIIPFLFQKIANKVPSSAWDKLKEDPDRYIYPAVRNGAGDNEVEWEASLPANIRRGLYPDTLHDIVEIDKPVKTLELRSDWNTPTPSSHGLPTEIWRETIARHQRCHEIRKKLRDGEVTHIDEFITLNLDIRQFAQDTVENADARLLLAFFKALRNISILDPTCGSGAFLFAALEILQPLYLACLERMRILLSDWQSAGESHPNWEKEFQQILDQAARHPNEAYYIHKTIMVHNLYGVDIMEEAVEICKLRLFLKLAAQLQPGQEVEPLPDIDFNIRAGNTLVGYSSLEEIQGVFTEQLGGGNQMLLGGIEHSLDDYQRILEQAEDADRAFKRFHQLQEETGVLQNEFREAKNELNGVLDQLRTQLDRFLAADYNSKNLDSENSLHKWRCTHNPFHWYVEFYGIVNTGGFDVIIGNPPYVGVKKVGYSWSPLHYTTCNTKNLYSLCLERAISLEGVYSKCGFIVPISLVSGESYSDISGLMFPNHKAWVSHFSNRPGKLFDGVEQRLTISLTSKQSCETFSSDYQHWYESQRKFLLQGIFYSSVKSIPTKNQPLKIGNQLSNSISSKLYKHKLSLSSITVGNQGETWYHDGPTYFIRSLPFRPTGNQSEKSTHYHCLKSCDKESSNVVCAILASSLFYFHFKICSNCRDFGIREIELFKIPDDISKYNFENLIVQFSNMLENTSKKCSRMYNSGYVEYFEYYPAKCKSVINEIDKVLSAFYNLSELEFDYIINYEIKYRMGIK